MTKVALEQEKAIINDMANVEKSWNMNKYHMFPQILLQTFRVVATKNHEKWVPRFCKIQNVPLQKSHVEL